MRLYITRQSWQTKDMRYQQFYNVMLPINHSSGYIEHGFEFNNDYFLLLAVI
jgi:hypothetical protein